MHSNFTTESESKENKMFFVVHSFLKVRHVFDFLFSVQHRFYKLHKGHHSDQIQIYKKNVSPKTRRAKKYKEMLGIERTT